MAATILTATDLATELETTSREVRKFLRAITPKDEQPGKGSRWMIEKKTLRSLRSQHAKWVAANEARAAEKAAEVEENEAEVTETEEVPAEA